MLATHLLIGVTLFAAQAVPSQGLVLDLTYDEGERFPLTRITAMTVGESGVLYVADALDASIAAFDSEGKMTTAIGREGRGPGEFARVGGIGLYGDTLWAVDPSLRRLVLFDVTGTHMETLSGLPGSSARWPRFSMETPPVTVLRGTHVALVGGASGLARRQLTLLDSVGRPVSVLATLDPTRQRLVLQGSRGIAVSTYQPLDDSPLWAPSPDGSRIVVVDREAPTSEVGSLLVSTYAANGEMLYRTSCQYPPTSVPESFKADIVGRAAHANLGTFGGALGAAEDGVRKSMYLPANYPPVDGMVVGRSNRVWLHEFATGNAENAVWLVLSPAGEPIAHVFGPPGLVVGAVDGDYVWGSEEDALGRVHAVRYRTVSNEPVGAANAAKSRWQCSTVS